MLLDSSLSANVVVNQSSTCGNYHDINTSMSKNYSTQTSDGLLPTPPSNQQYANSNSGIGRGRGHCVVNLATLSTNFFIVSTFTSLK